MTAIYGLLISEEEAAVNDSINARYKSRIAAEIKRLKGAALRHDNVELVAASEELKAAFARQAAIRLGKPVPDENGTPAGPRKRKGWKADLVTAWVTENLGETFRPEELAETLDVSAPTVYNWIKANRDRLLKVGRGNYQVVDRSEERNRK